MLTRPPSVWRAIAGATLAIAMLEGLMREVQYAPRIFSHDLGFVVPRGARTRWAVEGNGTGHYVEDGVRGGGLTWDGPTVLVVGDSFTEALHVDDEDTFVARAAKMLHSKGANMRLLNLGIAGQRTPSYVELADAYVTRFTPAWTVVVLNGEDLTADMFATSGSYFCVGAKGEPLKLERVPLDSGGSALRKAWRATKSSSALVQRASLQGVGFLGEMKTTHFFRAEARPITAPPLRASDYPIAQAIDLLFRAYRDRLSIVFLADYSESSPASVSDVEHAVLQACRARQRSCVSTRDENQQFVGTGDVPYGHPNVGRNVGHLNTRGHEAVANTIAAELMRLRKSGIL
jgi:hypothetical protein